MAGGQERGPPIAPSSRKKRDFQKRMAAIFCWVTDSANLNGTTRRVSILQSPAAECRQNTIIHFLGVLDPCRFRKRNPGPPPFSSMKSTPADSKARRIARSLAAVNDVSPSVSSARRMVATLKSDCRARSSAFQRTRARAALICALVSGFGMLTSINAYAIFHSI